MSVDQIRRNLEEAQSCLTALLGNEKTLKAVSAAGGLLLSTFKTGGRVFSCGNGGSMCDAMHFAEELSARYRLDRAGLPAVAISDPAHITCAGNDFGYEFIFSRYLDAHGKKGDCLVAISTSGKSKNVIKAVEVAKSLGIKVIGMVGKPDTPLASMVDICISTPGGAYADRVQELHIKVIHNLIEMVERDMFPENYK